MKGFSTALIILIGLVLAAVLVGIIGSKRPFVPPPSLIEIEQEAETSDSPDDSPLFDAEVAPTPLPAPINDVAPKPDPFSCGLHVLHPKPNAIIISPAAITGYTVAGPCWPSFEGEAGTVKITDSAGNVLSATIPVTLLGDWMTTAPVNFNLSLSFTDPTPNAENLGFLHFENDAGDVATPRVFKIPVTF